MNNQTEEQIEDRKVEQTEDPRDKFLGLISMNWRWEISSIPFIRNILKKRWFPMAIIIFNMLIFTVILLGGVVGGFGSGNYSFTIMIVWILWWVLLMMILVPIFSRTWCMICPLPSFGEWLQRLRVFGVNNDLYGMNLKWPKVLRNMWLINLLFLLTTFFTGYFTVKPLVTFILLGGIIVLAVVFSLIFEKRTFCLYICPVSGFQGYYSNMAMSEIRVKDPAICAKHKKKTCFEGNKHGYGCPWLLKPYEFKRNTYCGMCLECFKTCPFDNMAFNFRAPGCDLLQPEKRGLDEAWKGFMMLGIAIMFYVAMMGPWGFLKDWVRGTTFTGWLSFVGLHVLMSIVLIPAIFFVFVALSKAFSRAKGVSLKTAFINLSYIHVPLGLAAWIAFSFGFLLPNGSYILHVLSDPFAWGWNLIGTARIPWTPVFTQWLVPIQFITLFIGYVISADFAYKLSKQTYGDESSGRRGFLPILAYLTLIIILFGWLYGG